MSSQPLDSPPAFDVFPFSDSGLSDYPVLVNALGVARNQLQQLFSSADALRRLDSVFDITDYKQTEELITRGSLGNITFPTVKVLSTEALGGAFGAYSGSNNTIYISRAILSDDSLVGTAAGTLLEEYGHYIDTLVNPGRDTAGDEGELFKHVVLGTQLSRSERSRILAENDWGYIQDGDTTVKVERSLIGSGTTVDVGSLSGFRSFNGLVDSTVPDKYYSFTLETATRFRLDLTGLSADANVQLLRGDGNIVASSAALGTANETIRRNLSAGTYVVRVLQFDGDTRYSLRLTSDIAGGTMDSAFDIGTLSGSRVLNDSINANNDSNDYYRFDLANTSNFSLTLDNLSQNADVLLLDGSGNLIQFSSSMGTTRENIRSQLTAGTYFVRVVPFGSAITNYRLTLAADDFAGNTSTTGTVSIGGSRTGVIETGGDSDWFRVDLEQGRTYQLRQNRTTLVDPVLALRNSSGEELARDDNSGGDLNSLITYTATYTGTHYLDARGVSSTDTGSYTVSAALIDGAGNTMATARDLGSLSGSSRFFRDFVGTTDTDDYYRFTLSSGGNFSLTLNGLTANANVQLLNSSGHVIGQSNRTGRQVDQIDRWIIAGGTFFVRVFSVGDANTNYSLSLAA